jgi:hypothetical protein
MQKRVGVLYQTTQILHIISVEFTGLKYEVYENSCSMLNVLCFTTGGKFLKHTLNAHSELH